VQIILASSSPYRKQLLAKLGLEFNCESPSIDEYPLPNESAKQMAERLSIQKAQAVANNHNNAVIIGSDQAAAFGSHIIGKPGNRENAIKQLRQFSGQRLTFYTGLCVINSDTLQQRSLVESIEVTFRQLSANQIVNYLDAEQPYDCAGSFKSEGLGISLFTAINGRDPNTLIGLPLIALCDLLPEFNIQVI
jgi:MAF protein